MTFTSLKTIKIDELKVGMFVHNIQKQRGKIKIKSQGRVASNAVIEQLKSKGILTLEIVAETVQVDKPNIASEPNKQAISKNEPELVLFEQELEVAKALHRKGLVIQRQLMRDTAKGLPINVKMSKSFTDSLVESLNRNPSALICMTKMREKDNYLIEHSLNVSILLANFAIYVGLPKIEVEELALAGFLHDIGKVKIPNRILQKPSKLTDQEMAFMRDHVQLGERTLSDLELPERVIETMAQHHERLDGKGYPLGLAGDQIGMFGRMIGIVDSYDAMTSKRVYQSQTGAQTALKTLLKESPSRYDRTLVQQFIKCIGVYPIGSYVELNNGHIAMVISHNNTQPTRPVLTEFYSTITQQALQHTKLDLASNDAPYRIEKPIAESDLTPIASQSASLLLAV